MANYTKATNFTAKDTLPTGNSGKIVKGAEIDTEFTAIASAISSKADLNSPAFTGTPTTSTATVGTNTTQIASTAYVRAEITALSLGNMSTQAKTAVDITGGTIVGITDLAVADGGTGRSTLTANAVLIGNGTSGIISVAPSTSGNVLTSDGTSWTSAPNPEYVKVWVNFNGTGTPSIRGSHNVTSITDHSIGEYTVNFTNALSDTNYAVVSLNSTPGGTAGDATQVNTYATTSVRLKLFDRDGSLYDATQIHVVVFR